MTYEHIAVTECYGGEEHVALVELNRPKALNALCTPLMKELVDAFFRLNDGGNCRCIILTGRGKAFAAGADIAEMEKETPVQKVMEDRFPCMGSTPPGEGARPRCRGRLCLGGRV